MATSTPRSSVIGLRVRATDREAWRAAAARDGRTLSSWIAARLNGLPTTAPATAVPPEMKRKVR